MAFINRVPQGLLGLLDLKAQGENPAQLNPFVQATLELRDLYAFQTRATLSSAVAVAGLGQVVAPALTVPQGEMWIMYSLGVVMSAPPIAAGATLCLSLGVSPADLGGRFVGLAQQARVGVAGEDIAVPWQGVYILGPGDAPAAWVTTFTGAPGGIRLTISRSRFNI